MHLKIIAVLITVFIAILVLTFQQTVFNSSEPAIKSKINVYVTTPILFDIAYNIVNDKANIFLALPPGVDIHEWEPTPKFFRDIVKADVLVYNGADLEPWIKDLASSLEHPILMVEASKGLRLMYSNGNVDPHVWMDPLNVKRMAENVFNVLAKIDPKNANFYKKRLVEFTSKLEDLHAKFLKSLAPYKGRIIVVQHDAYAYLTAAYGIKYIAIYGMEREEPSPSWIADVIRVIDEENIKVIFVEEFGSKLINSIAEDLRLEILTLYIMMGMTEEDIINGKGYLYFMELNLSNLLKGLKENG